MKSFKSLFTFVTVRMSQKTTFKVKHTNPKVPAGHILVNIKWRGTNLGLELTRKCNGILSDELGVVDFYPAENCPVLYFSTADFSETTYKKRLKYFLETCNKREGTVIAERNAENIREYNMIQNYAMFSLSMFMFPVVGTVEIPDILKDMSHMASRSPNNPFKRPPIDENVLASKQLMLLTIIPNVGRKKAQDLLDKLGHVKAVCEASEEVLAKIVGPACSKCVWRYFHESS